MLHTVTTERRQHRRYLISGKAIMDTSLGRASGELVDVGQGGLLLFSDVTPPKGTGVAVYFIVQGYPLQVEANGKVVRSEAGTVGINFTDEPPELEEVLLWLEAGFMAALL